MIPLFPLHTVLFPGGRLPLRIFETRYLDMISRCLREDSGFGVNLIRAGREVGGTAACWPVGTYGRVADWESLPGGLLGITVTGERRYRVTGTEVRDDRLLQGRIEWLEEGETITAADLEDTEHEWLQPLLEHYGLTGAAGKDSGLVWRLADRLPLPLPARQQLLEQDSDRKRLQTLRKMLQQPDESVNRE